MSIPKSFWPEPALRRMHAEYMAGAFTSNLAKTRHRPAADLYDAWAALGLPLRTRKRATIPARTDPALVASMHAEYLAGKSFAELERQHSRPRSSVRSLFVTRGLEIRQDPTMIRHHNPDGTWKSFRQKTAAEIDALIAAATKIAIPPEIGVEWRHWDMPRRCEFIRRLRARIADPQDRPDLPFSSNVLPFHYGTPEAMAIIDRLNDGLPSQLFKGKICLTSQGVIWDGRLWFWSRRERYYCEGVKYEKGRARPALNRAIWESVNGPIPRQHLIRIIDGNPNNLAPSNLRLVSMNESMRENQFQALQTISRRRTAALLKRHQSQPHQSHEQTDTLSLLGSRNH